MISIYTFLWKKANNIGWLFCAMAGESCIILYLRLCVDVYMSNVYLNVYKRVLEMNYLPLLFIILTNMNSYVLYKK